MTPGILPLFSVPIAVARIEDPGRYLPLLEKESFGRVSTDNGWMTSSRRLLNDPPYRELKQSIDGIAQSAANFIWRAKSIQFSMTSSWAMKHGPNDSSHRHGHPNGILSGIVYISTTPISGNIVFYNNNDNLGTRNILIEASEHNEINSNTWEITPENGQILLFPSNLEHSVNKNESSIMRYCIAFNYFIEGKLGGNEMSMEIRHGY